MRILKKNIKIELEALERTKEDSCSDQKIRKHRESRGKVLKRLSKTAEGKEKRKSRLARNRLRLENFRKCSEDLQR